MTDTPELSTTSAPASAATVLFRAADQRVKRIPLQWPVSYQGRDFDAISIRRLTVAEVADFIKKAAVAAEDERVRFPFYVDDDGAPIPDAVLDGLDADDGQRVEEAATDFLPQQFRAAPSDSASSPADGAHTSSSSAA